MRPINIIILLCCISAIFLTDGPVPEPIKIADWACRTDTECEDEAVAAHAGERCHINRNDSLQCLPIDTR